MMAPQDRGSQSNSFGGDRLVGVLPGLGSGILTDALQASPGPSLKRGGESRCRGKPLPEWTAKKVAPPPPSLLLSWLCAARNEFVRVFHCDHCQQLVFFENTHCVSCNHPLAYLPDQGVVASLAPAGANTWRRASAQAQAPVYRLCANYDRENVCNWAVSDANSDALCTSCRLTRVIPDLSQAGNREAWYRMEVAKRRLVYSLLNLGLVLKNKVDDPVRGLAYEFLADSPGAGATHVVTGHDSGVITINLAEANDVQREAYRIRLGEPYRTLLGHFRHEIGHYFWDQLLRDSDRIAAFRGLFGDERHNYDDALRQYYDRGAPNDWQQRFISSYASSHPWEDWAETWAHYLHMTDALETAAACGLSLRPRRTDEPSLRSDMRASFHMPFERMMDDWFPLTYVLNNLNRGMGLPDGYPFVLSAPVIDKLRFVHETIRAA